MRKFIAAIFVLVMATTAFCGCFSDNDETDPPEAPAPEVVHLNTNLSADGYVRDKIGDFSVYENTDAYRVVTTADELVQAIVDAKYHYTNVWDDETGTYTQAPAAGYETAEGSVHVIEIANDLNLGYLTLSAAAKSSGVVDNFASKLSALSPYLYTADVIAENGVSQIKIENTSDLLVYSKNGAKLTHGGFKLTSDNNVVFRNLEFDEMWQWEDGNTSASKIGDYDWYGWAYFKIAFCGYIWIDHCTFGKSYDGQIDVSNPDYTANAGVAFRAPYGADGTCAVHISWCNFNAGSDGEDGYIYKMMTAIENEYQAHKASADPDYVSKHAYYDALRDGGVTFDEIMYGLAIPQKKGFLCGDSGDPYDYNLKLQISFANCTFKNLEDRLPKLRGGNAYMYNCVIDNSEYYACRTVLKSKNAAGIVKAVKSDWKCALVSQGIVCGNGGSVKAENCIYRGIEYLIKNNDTNTAEKVKGGYQLINCSYRKGEDDAVFVGSSSDTGNNFTNDTPAKLSTDNFSWHTADGKQPFAPSVTPIDGLEEFLADTGYGAGARSALTVNLLKSKY